MEDHWKTCFGRRRLARACDLFQDIWTMYQVETYNLDRVTFLGRQANGVVRVALDESKPDDRGWVGDFYAAPFPETINAPYEPLSDQEALLFDHQSVDI